MVPFQPTAAGHVNCYGYTCRSAASLNGTNSTPLVGFNFRVWRGATVTGFVPSLSGTSKENSGKKIQLLLTYVFGSLDPVVYSAVGAGLVNTEEKMATRDRQKCWCRWSCQCCCHLQIDGPDWQAVTYRQKEPSLAGSCR